VTPFSVEEIIMLHQLLLASYSQPEARGFILGSIHYIFLTIGGVIAAIISGVIAATKGRNPIGWGILGLCFSIVTLIVVIVIPSKK
jgi:MFS family permease